MEEQRDIAVEKREFDDGKVGERFLPIDERKFDNRLFSEGELDTLTVVLQTFSKTSTQQIIKISHEEKGWLDNVGKCGMISYQKYGFELKAL
jgi:hypothetical protein